MRRSFGSYLDPADTLAWPAKVRAIARDEYHFWRGTRDLFYAWCVDHCDDWRADPGNTVISHGDLHLGNLGSYAAAGDFGAMAYGLVDFDESARLPFQLDLLQGVITFELVARENHLSLSPADHAALHNTLFDTYANQLGRPTDNAGLRAMLKTSDPPPYADELKKFTHDGRFRTTVTKKGVVTDLLRPTDAARRAALAAALAEAVQHDARLARLLVPYDTADFEKFILDAAERTRVDSSGSQGLSKILVLLRRPFRGRSGDGLLYLKQQLPSAAERAGLVPTVPGPAARRYVCDQDALTHGQSLAASWCELRGRSYWVSVKEPWSAEPSSKQIKDVFGLLNAAAVWATVVADSHRDAADRVRPRLTPAVRATVVDRARQYLAAQADAFAQFRADPRTADDVARANQSLPLVRP